MSIIRGTFMQECSRCGCRFPVKYVYDTERKLADIEYDEAQLPCNCEEDFFPAVGVPSIGEWMKSFPE